MKPSDCAIDSDCLHHGRLLHEGTLAELAAATGCETLTEMFLQFIDTTPDDKWQPHE